MFPVEPDRWIAVIGAPRGPFSTEVAAAAGVEADVRASIRAVLEVSDPEFVLVDDLGAPWSPRVATAQLQRLGVRYRSRRRSWWRRLVTRRDPFWGDCPVCGHDWREHVPADGECGECRYEMEHGDPGAPTEVCRVMPRPPERAAGPACVITGVSADLEPCVPTIVNDTATVARRRAAGGDAEGAGRRAQGHVTFLVVGPASPTDARGTWRAGHCGGGELSVARVGG